MDPSSTAPTNPSVRLHSRRRAGMPRARARYLVQALELEERNTSYVAGPGIVLTTLLMIGAVVWASVTEVNEIARTAGEVIPSGLVQTVQHLEGGIVAEVAVVNAARVRKGDVLVRLSDERARGELAQLDSRHTALDLRRRRLEALLAGREPDFADDEAVPFSAPLVDLQRKVYGTQRDSSAEQLALIRAERTRLTAELASKASQVESLSGEVAALQVERQRLYTLLDRDLVAASEVSGVELSLMRAEGDLHQVQGERASLQAQLDASVQRERELLSRRRETWNLELEEVTASLAELEERRRSLRERVDRLNVRAPVDGIIQALAVNGPGAVVEPGQTLAQIVPGDGRLIVQTRISPSDIGHIRVGQDVDVKVSSYEPQRYGTLFGELVKVSPSTYLDENREPYYLAEVELQREYLGEDPGRHRVVTGMLVQADIITGRKTVLDYLLRPVYRGFTGALHER